MHSASTNPVQFHWLPPSHWREKSLYHTPTACKEVCCSWLFCGFEECCGTWGYFRYCSLCLEGIPPISGSAKEPATWGSKSRWGGTEGCQENGNNKKTLTKCTRLMSSHICFCKEVKQKQVLSSLLSFLSQMCTFQSMLKHICLKLH